MKHIRSYDKVFLTGCDKTTQWMLEWFLKNFHEHNKKIPLLIGDFGLTFEMKTNLKKNIEKIFKVNVTKINIINKQNRTKVTRGKKVNVQGYKKAIVTLKKGQSIDLTSGI